MIKATFEEQPKRTGGGYAYWEGETLCVCIDPRNNRQKKRLTAIHEVLNAHIVGHVKHSRFDKMAIDIEDTLQQLGL